MIRALSPTERTALPPQHVERECRSVGWGLAVAACALLAGCGVPAATVEPEATLAPATPSATAAPAAATTTPVARPTTGAATPHPTAGATAAGTRLPWPSATAPGATALQRQVDGGAQPWLLDPVQVAQSYAASLGWRDAQVSGGGSASPTHVTVRSSAGTHSLTLVQPGTRGPGGIWLVTADAG